MSFIPFSSGLAQFPIDLYSGEGFTYQTSSSQPWAMSSSSVPGDHLVRNEMQEIKGKMSQPLTLKLVLAHVDVGRRVDNGRLEVKDHFDWE